MIFKHAVTMSLLLSESGSHVKRLLDFMLFGQKVILKGTEGCKLCP